MRERENSNFVQKSKVRLFIREKLPRIALIKRRDHLNTHS
jgi:hypothetical protein